MNIRLEGACCKLEFVQQLNMAEFFKKQSDKERKSIRYPILLNAEEAETIRAAADSRQLSVAEFMRRAALGRRADVNFDVDLVLAMREISREINKIGKLHEAMIERGITPPVDDWREVKMTIRSAMVRVAQKAPCDFL